MLACYLFLAFMIDGCGINSSYQTKNSKTVVLAEAIKTGQNELKVIGYEYWDKDLSISADGENSVWNKYIQSSPAVLENEAIKKMQLDRKRYWAIYYVPKNYSGKGGDAFVFIDCSDGKIIGYLLGE